MILLSGGFSPALSKEAHMQKKYVVRLSDEEREQLTQIVRKFNGASQKVRRAQILLKADVDGPGWTDPPMRSAVADRPWRTCDGTCANGVSSRR